MAKIKATNFTPAPTAFSTAEPEPFSLGMPVQPTFDLIEVLPVSAAGRLRALRQRASDAHALVPGFEEQSEANTARLLAEQRLKRLTDPAHSGGFALAETDARVTAQRRTVDKLTDDAKRLSERSELRAKAWREAGAALQNAESWLREGKPHGVVLEDFEGPEPKLLRGESGLLDAIENRRRRVRELRADLHRIESAPYPSTYCKQQARAQIERLAQRGEVSVGLLVEHDREIIWPTVRLQSTVYGAPGAVAFAEGVPDTLALLAFLLKPTLIAALDRLIDQEADDKSALDGPERERRTAEVEADLLDIERQEASLCWSAMEKNLPCEFRGDINPVALLGLRLIARPHAVSAGTSPEWATDFIGGLR